MTHTCQLVTTVDAQEGGRPVRHCAEPGLNFSLRASSGEGKVGAWGSLSERKKLPVQPNKVPATGMKELK